MRARLVSVQIVPTYVIEDDDGNLSPCPPIQPVVIPANALDKVAEIVTEGAAHVEAQLRSEITT